MRVKIDDLSFPLAEVDMSVFTTDWVVNNVIASHKMQVVHIDIKNMPFITGQSIRDSNGEEVLDWVLETSFDQQPIRFTHSFNCALGKIFKWDCEPSWFLLQPLVALNPIQKFWVYSSLLVEVQLSYLTSEKKHVYFRDSPLGSRYLYICYPYWLSARNFPFMVSSECFFLESLNGQFNLPPVITMRYESRGEYVMIDYDTQNNAFEIDSYPNRIKVFSQYDALPTRKSVRKLILSIVNGWCDFYWEFHHPELQLDEEIKSQFRVHVLTNTALSEI